MTSGFDPIISLLIEIKNAHLSGASSIEIRHSKYREGVLETLSKMNLLTYRVFKDEGGSFKKIHVDLSQDSNSRRRMLGIHFYSKPGRRIYGNSTRLKFMMSKSQAGVVISTSKGVFSIRDAVKKNLGGELLFRV
jgi:ribosomal protein S8